MAPSCCCCCFTAHTGTLPLLLATLGVTFGLGNIAVYSFWLDRDHGGWMTLSPHL